MRIDTSLLLLVFLFMSLGMRHPSCHTPVKNTQKRGNMFVWETLSRGR